MWLRLSLRCGAICTLESYELIINMSILSADWSSSIDTRSMSSLLNITLIGFIIWYIDKIISNDSSTFWLRILLFHILFVLLQVTFLWYIIYFILCYFNYLFLSHFLSFEYLLLSIICIIFIYIHIVCIICMCRRTLCNSWRYFICCIVFYNINISIICTF